MTLRAGLIGLGMMGRHHARVLRSLPDVELVALADMNGDPHGVAGNLTVGPDVDFLISKGIDIAVVAVPTALHEETALQLAAAGVHTLVEKPLAGTTDAANAVADAFGAAGLVGAVGHIERFNPSLQSLRSRLEVGELGEVYQVSTRRQGPFPNRIADVGVVKDLATHDIDSTAWVTGSPFALVSAYTAHKSGREYEDLVAVSGRLRDNTVTNHLVNWLSPLKERTLVVTGDKGTFVADTLNADLTFYANGSETVVWDAVASFRGVTEGDVVRFAISKPEPLQTELVAFCDAVLGRPSNAVTMTEGVQIVRVAEAILKSATSGTVVEID